MTEKKGKKVEVYFYPENGLIVYKPTKANYKQEDRDNKILANNRMDLSEIGKKLMEAFDRSS